MDNTATKVFKNCIISETGVILLFCKKCFHFLKKLSFKFSRWKFANKFSCSDLIVKEGLQSVLRIGSAHNKGGPPNINIVQISHFSNSF